MNLSMMFILSSTLITMMLMMVINMITKKSILDKEKISSFECGFNQMSDKRMPFSIHFFLVAAIFLIFDVEVIIIMPMIMTMKTSMMKWWIMTSVSFIIVLIMGLYHEWKNGVLTWTT